MTTIQLRHDTATNWTTVNPILAEGEVGVETDTNKFKIGDGVTPWNNLDYQGGSGDLSNYYTKSETDTALSNKQDKFSAIVPLVMQEPSEPASPAITTEDDGITFTVDSGNGYNSIILQSGSGEDIDHSFLQLQTTENGNGIIDRTKNIVYDFEITETTDLEFRWASDDSGDIQVHVPKILLGKNNSNNVFNPSIVIGYNFSTTTPYENYLYISDAGASEIVGNSDPSGWTGTKYDYDTNYMNYIPLNYGYINLVKVRLYSDNSVIKIDITVSSEDEGPYTQSFDLSSSYMNDDINCAVFMTTMGVTYQGANFGVFDPTTGTQKWNPAKTLSRSLRLNIDNSLIVDSNALGVNSNNYYTKSEVDTEISNKADIDGSNMDASVKNFDGQIIWNTTRVSQATAIGNYTIDLSNYLPNDGKEYEVSFNAQVASVAGGLTGIYLNSVVLAISYNGVLSGGNMTIKIGASHQLTLNIDNSNCQSLNLWAYQYRRLGTNQ